MQFLPTALAGVVVIEPKVFEDDRGFFMESYHRPKFSAAGIDVEFVQDNHSRSRRGVLRGLHYQLKHPQGKLIRVIQGEIYDVAVDLRRSSPTFGSWCGCELSDRNRRQMYVPLGFAHGFCVTSEAAEVIYKCTEIYHPEDEHTLLWNDPALGITWPLAQPTISPKDERGLPLSAAPCYA